MRARGSFGRFCSAAPGGPRRAGAIFRPGRRRSGPVALPRPPLAAALLLLGACAPLYRPDPPPPLPPALDADDAPEATEAQGAPPPPAPGQADGPLQPACSEVVSGRRAVEALRNPRFLPRVWLADTQLATLQLGSDGQGRPREAFREALPVRGEALELVGVDAPLGPSVLLVRRMPVGVCVVGSWSTDLPGETRVALAGRVLEAGGARAALLLRVDGLDAPRWVALATDGHALWPALGERRRPQMLVPAAELARVDGAAELTLVIEQRNRYRLDGDGRFAPWSGLRAAPARRRGTR